MKYTVRCAKDSGTAVIHTTELDWAFHYIEARLADPMVKRITLVRA